MNVPAFESLPKEDRDRLTALVLSGDTPGILRELSAIVVNVSHETAKQIKRLQASSPNLPTMYAALQAELALLSEIEALIVELLNSTAIEEN